MKLCAHIILYKPQRPVKGRNGNFLHFLNRGLPTLMHHRRFMLWSLSVRQIYPCWTKFWFIECYLEKKFSQQQDTLLALGAAGGSRTHYFYLMRVARYRFSTPQYKGEVYSVGAPATAHERKWKPRLRLAKRKIFYRRRFEPPLRTFLWLSGTNAYDRRFWYQRVDSNHRPLPYEGSVLTDWTTQA